jgi:hypothetical protein
MKTKLFLMLFALNGLLWGANSASAAPAHQSIANLSHTISNLVDLDAADQGLVELAINRALLAKNIRNDRDIKVEHQKNLIAGNYSVEDFNGRAKNPAEPIAIGQAKNPNPGPIINGRVANPNQGPIINGVIVNPNPGPIINGRVANPRPKPPIDKEPPVLINGIIYNPNQQPQRR